MYGTIGQIKTRVNINLIGFWVWRMNSLRVVFIINSSWWSVFIFCVAGRFLLSNSIRLSIICDSLFFSYSNYICYGLNIFCLNFVYRKVHFDNVFCTISCSNYRTNIYEIRMSREFGWPYFKNRWHVIAFDPRLVVWRSGFTIVTTIFCWPPICFYIWVLAIEKFVKSHYIVYLVSILNIFRKVIHFGIVYLM